MVVAQENRTPDNLFRGLPGADPTPIQPLTPVDLVTTYGAAELAMDPKACDGINSEALITIDGYRIPATLTVTGGQDQLLRIVNGTSDSPKTLELRDESGAVVPMHVTEIDANPFSGARTDVPCRQRSAR